MASSHLPFFSLSLDLGISSLSEELHLLCLITLGLRGAAKELLHVGVQTALSCLGSVNSVLPALKSVFSPLRLLFSWHGLLKTSLPWFCHVPTPKDIYITVDILYAVEINGHIFQLYLHSFISFNDSWNQNNGLYPLRKDFILHCIVLEFGPGIRRK